MATIIAGMGGLELEGCGAVSRDEKLRIIGQHINWWLDYNAKQFEREGMDFSDDSHVVPPVWPSRGQLKKWVEVLFDEAPSNAGLGEGGGIVRTKAEIEQGQLIARQSARNRRQGKIPRRSSSKGGMNGSRPQQKSWDRMKESWCILRTSGRKTIPLADSLKRHGIDAWTPREIRKQRLPRSRAAKDIAIPIMPSFVFARASSLGYLAQESQNLKSPHPQFSIQRYQNKYPLVADSELRALRDAERRTIPLERVSSYNAGDIIKMREGGFAGLQGVVQTSDGKHTMIAFAGSKLAIKISTLLLREEYAMEPEVAA